MPQDVTRTVCVGLGGTGRDVLMCLRRLIVDRYGSLTNFPIVSFLHIDTDVRGSNVTGLRTGSIYRGQDISFQQDEQVFLTISQEEIDLFIRSSKNRKTQAIGPFDHILQWFDPLLLQNGRGIEQGAGGIRAIGRLAFFWNYEKVHTSVERAKAKTQGHDATLLQQKDLKVNSNNNIFITGSLCGGTGSGIFLDVAYSLKKIYEGNTIIGYFTISPELCREGMSNRMQAGTIS